jgi:DNA-binding transcriptional ArsR family regulator
MKPYQKDNECLLRIFKALSNKRRLKILLALRTEKCNVGNISERIKVPQAIVSQQLTVLRKLGMVSSKRQNKNELFYSVSDEFISKILDLAEHSNLKGLCNEKVSPYGLNETALKNQESK